ncbi:MAG: AAA family ATPase, partial [Chloroflexi bacterium]|nr:AAA family ATPase [Chloroflexota bacterium]
MSNLQPVPADQLCHVCDPAQFSFQTTDELEDLDEIIGQERAIEAIQFGIGIQSQGYNLFALGPSGTGKRTTIRRFLDQRAAAEPTPDDWCYINNFEQPHRPRALRLPAGRGTVLRDDMKLLIDELRTAIPAAFGSEDYRTRRQEVEEEFKEQQEDAFKEVQRQAQERNIRLIRTPAGLAFVPIRDDEILGPDEFQKLPDEERERIEQDIADLQAQLQATVPKVREWERKAREKVKELDREVALFAVGARIEELRRKFSEFPAVVDYLNAVQEDVIDSVDEFRNTEESPQQFMGVAVPRSITESALLRRYQVNVLIDHSKSEGAPVVYEDNPTYLNLIGNIEHVAHMGALMTDFTLIKPGALHRANGGYLIIDARELLSQPYSWQGIKRALRSQEIKIESLGQALSLVTTVSLDPEPIPLDVKIVLIGERQLYYLLYQFDPDFSELFKAAADFNVDIPRTPESSHLYARLIATMARKDDLRPLDRSAVARILSHSARMAGDAEKMSIHLLTMSDLLRETDYWASINGNGAVTADDVQRAIDAQIHRADRVRERMQEEILRGTIFIDTTGAHVGQVNALSVISLGEFSFGRPSRITARVRVGKGQVADIEREVELGGPLHSKGVLILTSFLGARYAAERPFSLSASLVFEQSYGGVDGDSASLAELCALLSALANVPIRQSWAMTGSVNQFGRAQPIGGVNQKIEGFFDVCLARGLTGEQGVIIPMANVKHLMLREDVVEAARAGKFHIYAVQSVDEAM